MKKDLLHTPEGVRDIYGVECRKKILVTDLLRNVCDKYGYGEIQTPTFEFFDVFNSERGSVPSNELFKFFDHHGSTLVLRPDMTPSIARTAAKYFADYSLPTKLSYVGNTFINYENSYRGTLKENTIVGGELIGDGNTDEDFEIICMVIDSMKAVGLKNFQVEIGNIRFFKGLMKESGIGIDDEEELVSLINNKNFFGVEEKIKELKVSSNVEEAIMALPGLFGNKTVLDRARAFSDYNDCIAAIDRLSDIYEKLKDFGYEEYVSFDLGSLSNHAYYTGIIFHAYTFGTGDAVLSGGRYDKLISQFGKDKPSIGYSILVDRIIAALNRQEINVLGDQEGALIVYTDEGRDQARNLAFGIRKAGNRASLIAENLSYKTEDYFNYANEWHFKEVYFVDKSIKQLK